MKSEMALGTESKERLEKGADHSRLVNGRSNAQGNFHMGHVFIGGKTHRSPHLTTAISRPP